MMQGQLDTLNENIERLIKQVRIANSYRFGKHTETLDSIDGQLSFFDEAENCCNLSVPEPAAEEVLPSRRNHKKKGQRETDLKDFPEEILPPYQVSTEELDTFYGAGNWHRMKDETYKRLRHEPESWTVEVHTVEVESMQALAEIIRTNSYVENAPRTFYVEASLLLPCLNPF